MPLLNKFTYFFSVRVKFSIILSREHRLSNSSRLRACSVAIPPLPPPAPSPSNNHLFASSNPFDLPPITRFYLSEAPTAHLSDHLQKQKLHVSRQSQSPSQPWPNLLGRRYSEPHSKSRAGVTSFHCLNEISKVYANYSASDMLISNLLAWAHLALFGWCPL